MKPREGTGEPGASVPSSPPGRPAESESRVEKPSVYFDDTQTLCIRASAFGNSLHSLVAAKQGLRAQPWDDKTLGYFAEGNLHEASIIERLAPIVGQTTRQQEEVTLEFEFAGVRVKIVGHIDGYNETQKALVEVKALGDSTYKKFKSSGLGGLERYEWQTSIYAHALGVVNIIFACKNRNSGEIDYQILQPRYTLDDIATRARVIAERHDAQTRPGEKCSDFPCRYSHLHIPDAPGESLSDARLEQLCLDDYLLGTQIKKLQDRREEVRADVRSVIGDKQKVKAGEWSVVVTVQSRKKWDYKGLEARYGDALSDFVSSTESETLRITKKGADVE